uniref:Uncharacterized protein n=1 Tax=Rhipicephalus zambeziensis TaxID=60191 RepID=A0A224YAD6_9ACAR
MCLQNFTSHSSVDTGCMEKAMTPSEIQSHRVLKPPRAKSTVTGDDCTGSRLTMTAPSLSFFIKGELAVSLHLPSPSVMPPPFEYSSIRLLVLLAFPKTRGIYLAMALPTIKKHRHCLQDPRTVSNWRPWESVTRPQRCPYTMWSCQRPLLQCSTV